jgi:hypothetical protein
MCIRENQVIFPQDLCKRLDRYSERLYALAAVFGFYWRPDEILTPEKMAVQDKMLADASSALEGEIRETRDKLIDDLRGLLAGSSVRPSPQRNNRVEKERRSTIAQVYAWY